jgi:hypothetical protein
MKTKTIISKLETLFGINEEQKSKVKQLKSITKLITLLESKEQKFRTKLDALEAETEIQKYRRKLNITELHLAKAKTYKQQLEA